jgi:hypothetical protein
MDDDTVEKLQQAVMKLGEYMLTLDGNLAEIEASVAVLKLLAVTQLFPDDDPLECLKQLSVAEQKYLKSSPRTGERQSALEALEMLRQWKRSGTPPAQS